MVAFVGDDLDPFLVDLGIMMYRVGNQVICVCLPCDMCFLYIYNDHSFYDLVSRTLFA